MSACQFIAPHIINCFFKSFKIKTVLILYKITDIMLFLFLFLIFNLTLSKFMNFSISDTIPFYTPFIGGFDYSTIESTEENDSTEENESTEESQTSDGEYSRDFIEDYKEKLNNRHLQINDVNKRYFEILDLHQSADDYVGLHGQALSLMVFNDLIKQIEILKSSDPSIYENFEFFRVPSKERYQSVQQFFDNHPTDFNYLDEEGNEVSVQGSLDSLYGNKLLSFDVCVANTQIRESAYYFSAANESMILEPEVDEEFQPEWKDPSQHPKMAAVAEYLLESYTVSTEKHPQYISRILKLVGDVERNNILFVDEDGQAHSGVGNLYVMFLPKTLFDEENQSVMYLSMEQGVHYNPADYGFSRDDLLEKLQICDPEIIKKYTGEWGEFFPQGRIICSHLTPETGVKIFKLNCLSPKYIKEYDAKVRNLAIQIFNEIETD